jgi:hypothetical protein
MPRSERGDIGSIPIGGAKMSVKLVGKRKRYEPKDTDEVFCETHNFRTTWGKLDAIQQLSVEEGIDTLPDLPCLLCPRSSTV